jgi:glycine/D-amino acid oxidase-like deaminating enzyme
MKIDYLIVGQGICGTWLSHELLKANQTVLVVDIINPNSPSRLAAGLINPITGRRHVKTWLADEMLSAVEKSYHELAELLNTNTISKKQIVDFFPNMQMQESFSSRIAEDPSLLSISNEKEKFSNHFQFEFGIGIINQGYTVHLNNLLDRYRAKLAEQHLLLEEKFNIEELNVFENHIEYKNIQAGKIIFCDGNESIRNKYFNKLPFAPNKGEALVLRIEQLDSQFIYKKGMMLIPLSEQNFWWLGSSYAWSFDNDQPTNDFSASAQRLLNSWIKPTYSIEEHRASIRPATLERRPFVGLHPHHKAVGIFNGMGTKGCSLAPYFAKEFTAHLLENKPLNPEANISRCLSLHS